MNTMINAKTINILSRLNGTIIGRLVPKKVKDIIFKIITVATANTGIEQTETITINSAKNVQISNILRPCHYKQLFIKSNGEVYPCCRVWSRKELMIGHVTDVNLFEKILKFDPPQCTCKRYTLIKSTDHEVPQYFNLNIEFSLACQAKCAMCCVNAPDWSGSYDYYSNIEKLIFKMGTIDKVVSQGGEVLIQRNTLDFIKKLKNKHLPAAEFSVITNGNIDLKNIEEVEAIFDRMMISMVGFQPETYKKIMGIEINKTIEFAETIIKRRNIKLTLKYLTTPINYHEQNLFLNWALSLTPDEIVVCDAQWKSYIKENTDDEYWEKIAKRTVDSVIKELQKCNIIELKAKKTIVNIENLESYGITPNFLKDNNLCGLIKEYDT